MSKTFDPALPVQTRGGRPARIIATDLNAGNDTIAAAITNRNGVEGIYTYLPDGLYFARCEDELDLVNIEPTVVEFVNLGDSYSNFTAAAASAPGWNVLRVEMQGERVISAKVVTE